MRKYYQFVKKYPFSITCFILIWVLSLMPFFPETGLEDVAFIDKWTHLVMYGGTCGVLWMEYLRAHTRPKEGKKGTAKTPSPCAGGRLFLLAWLAPVLMSGLLELLQEYATTTRSGEWMDFAANSLGVSLGAVFGLIVMRIKRKIKPLSHY
ncbi:MAG: VanZ family protein [Prevotella sp.]|nr:VanZ family protein [Prevotella sp.]